MAGVIEETIVSLLSRNIAVAHNNGTSGPKWWNVGLSPLQSTTKTEKNFHLSTNILVFAWKASN